ncbi:hypothetical protein [Nostoc sp.]
MSKLNKPTDSDKKLHPLKGMEFLGMGNGALVLTCTERRVALSFAEGSK